MPSTAPLPLRGIPDIAPFQLLLSDYMKRKVQVVYAALDTFYLYLADLSHLKDFYPKVLYAAFLPHVLAVYHLAPISTPV